MDDDSKDPIRATKCPSGHEPYTVQVKLDDVIAVVTLKGLRLDDDSVARLKALGHSVFDVMG